MPILSVYVTDDTLRRLEHHVLQTITLRDQKPDTLRAEVEGLAESAVEEAAIRSGR